jgi:hypothetical protein
VKHFLPSLGITEEAVRTFPAPIDTPDISVEFQIAYRFGHDMIPPSIGTFDTTTLFGSEDFFFISSAEGTSQPEMANQRMDQLLSSAATSLANEIDGRLSDAVRNTLFGAFGEDLASRNLFRSRELGLPTYSSLAECFGTAPDMQVCTSSPAGSHPSFEFLASNCQVALRAWGMPVLSRSPSSLSSHLLFAA